MKAMKRRGAGCVGSLVMDIGRAERDKMILTVGRKKTHGLWTNQPSGKLTHGHLPMESGLASGQP